MWKKYLLPLIEYIKDKDKGLIGAGFCFVLSLFLVIFGFWKTLFIVAFTAVGYYIGVYFFSDPEDIRNLLDKLFPPGRFR